MSGGMGGRLAAWFANEVMAKTLSKSETFRKIVVRTHDTVEKVKVTAAQAGDSNTAKNLVDQAKQKVGETQKGSVTMFDSIKKGWRQLEEEGRQLKEVQNKKQ